MDGEIVETNAFHHEGSKVTLMELDFGKLFENQDKMEEVRKVNPKTVQDVMKFMKDLQGIKVDLNNKIEVKFKHGDDAKLSQKSGNNGASENSKDEGMNTKLAEQFYNVGKEYYDEPDFKMAEKFFKEAVKFKPDLAEAQILLGEVYQKSEKFEEAVDIYLEMLKNNPSFTILHVNIGNCLYKLGKSADALVEYKKAVEGDPGIAEAHNNIGLIFLEQGQNGKAIEQFINAIDLQFEYVNAHKNLSVAYKNLGFDDNANKELDIVDGLTNTKSVKKTKPDVAARVTHSQVNVRKRADTAHISAKLRATYGDEQYADKKEGVALQGGEADKVLEVYKLLEESYRTGNGKLWLEIKSMEVLKQMDATMKEMISTKFPSKPEKGFKKSSVIVYKKSAAVIGEVLKIGVHSMFHAIRLVKEDGAWKIVEEKLATNVIDPHSFLPPEDGSFIQQGLSWGKVAYAEKKEVDPRFNSFADNWAMQAAVDESFLYVRLVSKANLAVVGTKVKDKEDIGIPQFPNIDVEVVHDQKDESKVKFGISVGDVLSTSPVFDENGKTKENIYKLNYSMSLKDDDFDTIFWCHADSSNGLLGISNNLVDIKIPCASLGLQNSDSLQLIVFASNGPFPDFEAYEPLLFSVKK